MPEGANFTPLIVGLVALLIGWVIGFFDSNNRSKKKIQAAEKKAEAAIQQAKAEAERAVAAQVAQAAPPNAPAQTGITLLRLWQGSAAGPQLELDGRPLDTGNLSEPMRKRLIALITFMRPWVEGRPSAASPASLPATFNEPAPPVQPVPVTLASALSATRRSPQKDEKPAAPLSMVQQIDAILQTRLANGPLAGRGIKLTESPDGGVTVVVGAQKFNGLGDVPDADIQSAIRAAIAEWEK